LKSDKRVFLQGMYSTSQAILQNRSFENAW